MSRTPPERVSVDSITIRRWVDADAAPLHALILANLDHLRPWMAWIAAEPLSLAEREAKIGEWTRRWDDGVDFPYAIADGSGTFSAAVVSTGVSVPQVSRSDTGSAGTGLVGASPLERWPR
jgi:hypothetical protein